MKEEVEPAPSPGDSGVYRAPGKTNGGPSHAADLAFVFNNLDKPREVPDNSDPAVVSKSPPDIKLADQMSSYWVNFAKAGDPNGTDLPTWPRHVAGDGKIFEFRKTLFLYNGFRIISPVDERARWNALDRARLERP